MWTNDRKTDWQTRRHDEFLAAVAFQTHLKTSKFLQGISFNISTHTRSLLGENLVRDK